MILAHCRDSVRMKLSSGYLCKENSDDSFKCNVCRLNATRRAAKVKDHLEAVHFLNNFRYDCEYCSSLFYSRNAHRVHLSIKNRYR